VLTFAGSAKELICNKTQSLSMMKITGTEIIEDWKGAVVQLVPTIAPNNKPTIQILPAPQARQRAATATPVGSNDEDADWKQQDEAADPDDFDSDLPF
jgi:hypothetical protein